MLLRTRSLLLAAALLWLNLYIARDLFTSDWTGHHNSMHGFWIAMARHAGEHWFLPGWWRFWDAGMPFEFTYAPLVPALTAAWSRLAGVSEARAFQSVTGLFYCLAPVSLFALAATLTRKPGWSFAAAAAYSLLAPTQWLTPDQQFGWSHLGDARRLYLMAVWDETPHVAALTMLPLVLLFAALGIRTGRTRHWALSGLFMALAVLANAFGATMLLMGLVPLLLSYGRDRWPLHGARIAAAGALAYLAICPTLPPSLLSTIRANANNSRSESPWETGSWAALAAVILGIALIQWALDRRGASDWTRFTALFAWITASTPLLQHYLGRHYLPQPGRYKVEAAMALSLLIVFALRPLLDRCPVSVRAAVALLALAFGAEQTVSHRRFEKLVVRSVDATRTIEYRVAAWLEANVPGRVFVPGSIAQWLNAFSRVEQVAGSSYSTAYNPVQQMAYWELFQATPAESGTVLAWLKAYGVQAATVPGKTSPEFWKAFAHPTLFEGKLEVLWREDDTTIYRVPQSSASYAHALPRDAIVGRAPRSLRDSGQVERFAAALDRATPATFEWTGVGSARISTTAGPAEAISVQVTHHPGWRARSAGREIEVHRDGLGLMWLEPGCSGPCEVELEFRGSTEQWISRALAVLTWLLVAAWAIRRRSYPPPHHLGNGPLPPREVE